MQRSAILLLVWASLSLAGCRGPSPSTNADERPRGAEARDALGVPMPAGTYGVDEMEGAGPEGASERMAALATRLHEGEALAYFRALPGAVATRAGCVRVQSAEVCVMGPDAIPQTLFAPVRPVASATPGWANAWIRVSRSGAPPPCPPCVANAFPPPGCRCP
jgi:hypothetical protein